MGISIREERSADYPGVEQVIKSAFMHAPMRSGTEHQMVERMREDATFNPSYSLVATDGEEIIGHVMLAEVYVVDGQKKTPLVSLGPVSVAPVYQRRGIGAKLIEDVLKVAKHNGENAAIVLGHPTYYPRFGFKRASLWGITLPFDAPDDAFLAVELTPGGLQGTAGIVEYVPALLGD